MALQSLLLVLYLSFCAQMVAGWTILDDTDAALVYSNSGPGWWGADGLKRMGIYVSNRNSGQSFMPYMSTWHEAYGDGAYVSLTFTGTRVNLTATICNYLYNTTVDFYLDGEKKSTYTNIVPLNRTSPNQPYTTFLVTLADLKDLSPAQHVFKAVSVGNDSLFVVDAVSYEASAAAAPVPSNSTSSSTLAISTDSTRTSSSSSTTSRSASLSSQSSTSTNTADVQPVVAAMDVPASDPRIVYSPPGAWSQYSSARRSTSCLQGTMSSSTANSFITYNFTGTAVQVYTISSPNGGNYTVGIDGQNQGTYSSYDPAADLFACSSRPLFSTMGLLDTQHTLVLIVEDDRPGSSQDTIQFVGIRTPASANNSPGSASQGPNLGTIIGGVVGGLVGLILLVLVIMWWMRRQRRKEEESLAAFADSLPTPGDMDTHSQANWVAHSSTSTVSRVPPQMVQHTYRPGPVHLHVDQEEEGSSPGPEEEDRGTVERLTYYTLPSYHDNVMQRPAARNLSEADVNAISRRLREVMASQMQQNGHDRSPHDPAGVSPPRELIDHLVQEQLQPRAP